LDAGHVARVDRREVPPVRSQVIGDTGAICERGTDPPNVNVAQPDPAGLLIDDGRLEGRIADGDDVTVQASRGLVAVER
jgi:hypothetical protein